MSSISSSRASSSDLSPLSPDSVSSNANTLPEWLRPGRRRSRFLSNSKLKLGLVAAGFVLLGWMTTTALGPVEELALGETDFQHDLASAGILTDPSGFGVDEADPDSVDSHPIGGKEASRPDDFEQDIAEKLNHKGKPTVNGALADLHSAVSDRIQGWRPKFGGSHGARPSAAPEHNNMADKYDPDGSRTKSSTPKNNSIEGEHVREGVTEEARLGARTRIGKCTILFNGNAFWERAIKTHEEHDRIHGYRLHVLRQNLLDDVWSKPAYILSLLLREMAKPESDRLEWLLWVDADTVILNPKVPIEVFLPPQGTEFDDIHLMYSKDWNGLNNGVFPVRVNQWSVQLFAAITAYRHYNPTEDLVFRDQSAMDNLIKHPKFKKNIVEAPQRWFNAYQGEHNETLSPYQIRRGDLLVHFAGVGNREERMGYWLNRAEQHLEDWEISVKSTSYPQEARDFWDEERGRRNDADSTLADARKKAEELLSSVESRVNDYGDRLNDVQKTEIEAGRQRVTDVMNDEASREDAQMILEHVKALEETISPLIEAISRSHQLLLEAAHEAIFAGEKDLLEAGYSKKGAKEDKDPALSLLAGTIKSLKDLIMQPQEKWSRESITDATNAVTHARAEMREKKEAAAQRKTTLDLAKAQVMKEAGIAELNAASGTQASEPDAGNAVKADQIGSTVEAETSADPGEAIAEASPPERH